MGETVMHTSPAPKSSALVVEWQMRLGDLRAKLRLQSDDPQAWQWRLEAKVLVYMLARYDQLAAFKPLPTAPTIFIAKDVLMGRVKERLSRLRRHQLLADIEKNQEQKAGAMDNFFEAGDAYLQRDINERRKRRQRGY